eukprot:1533122-Heterocapsa_arctica.AAC.1
MVTSAPPPRIVASRWRRCLAGMVIRRGLAQHRVSAVILRAAWQECVAAGALSADVPSVPPGVGLLHGRQ